jgi:hypothetical protein
LQVVELLVDLIGIEPMTSSMPWKRAPSCATGPLLGRQVLLSGVGAAESNGNIPVYRTEPKLISRPWELFHDQPVSICIRVSEHSAAGGAVFTRKFGRSQGELKESIAIVLTMRVP